MRGFIFSLLILVVGFLQPVVATSFEDYAYSNFTGSSSWTSPQGTKYLHGGSFSFRFKNQGNYTPWIDGKAPSLKIGCNGMSLEGGFLALLGLEDIENQLKDAGAQFAWGMLLTLKSSVPLIEQVFKDIQEWARMIQSLLQDACAAGTNLAKDSPAAEGIRGIFSDMSLDDYDEKKEMTSSRFKEWAAVDEWFDTKMSLGSSGRLDASSVLSESMKIFIDAGISGSMTSSIYGQHIPHSNSLTRNLYKGNISNLMSGSLSGLSLNGLSGTTKNNKAFVYKMIHLLYGDFALNKDAMETFFSKYFNLSTGNIDLEAVKNFAKKSSEGSTLKASAGMIYIKPLIAADAVSDILFNGFSALDANPNCSGNTCYLPNYEVYFVHIPTGTNGNVSAIDPSGASQVITTTPSDNIDYEALFIVDGGGSTNSNISMTFKGFYEESLDAIRLKVKNESGITSGYSWRGASPSVTSLSSVNVPLVFPGLETYTGLIAKIEKKYKTETAYTVSLKEMLARGNAYFAALSIVYSMEGLIDAQSKDSALTSSKESLKLFMAYKKNVKETNKVIVENVKKILKEQNIVEEYIETFKKIEETINKDIAGKTVK